MRPFVLVLVILAGAGALLAAAGALGWRKLHAQHSAGLAPTVPATPTPSDDHRHPSSTSGRESFDDAQLARPGDPPAPVAEPPAPLHEGPLTLGALEATVYGREIRVELGDAPGAGRVTAWRHADAEVRWPLPAVKPGWYQVELTFACGQDAGGPFAVSVGEQRLTGRCRPTSEWRTDRLGNLLLLAEPSLLTVQADGAIGRELMSLRQVRLVPVR